MIDYKWSILEVFGDQTISKVRFLLTAKDSQNTVETEGEHTFQELIDMPLEEVREQDLISALIKDNTQNEVNLIKLNLETQLKALKTSKKLDLPWETNTFKIG